CVATVYAIVRPAPDAAAFMTLFTFETAPAAAYCSYERTRIEVAVVRRSAFESTRCWAALNEFAKSCPMTTKLPATLPWQTLFEQRSDGHTTLHAPQLNGSLVVSTHVPLQSVSPSSHVMASTMTSLGVT